MNKNYLSYTFEYFLILNSFKRNRIPNKKASNFRTITTLALKLHTFYDFSAVFDGILFKWRRCLCGMYQNFY